MTFAVIQTGGKQYKVSEGQVLSVERLDHDGKEVTFGDVLLLDRGGETRVGRPFIAGALVRAEVLADGLGDKKMVFRYKNKTRSKKKRGHRQPFTRIRITNITA